MGDCRHRAVGDIAAEETLKKAAAAEVLPRSIVAWDLATWHSQTLIGDMAASFYVGFLLQKNNAAGAIGIASAFSALGVAWLIVLFPKIQGIRLSSDAFGA